MHIVESRFVIGPSNILFGDVYECSFQPGNFTGWGSEEVKEEEEEEGQTIVTQGRGRERGR